VACAAEQGAFWPLHDRFMAGDETLFTPAGLRRQIEFEGIDYGAFNLCLTEGETLPQVIASRNEGQSRGVPGTPTVFVNGERIDATFEAIEEAVRRAIGE
jgi:protein-disulfide isomerase